MPQKARRKTISQSYLRVSSILYPNLQRQTLNNNSARDIGSVISKDILFPQRAQLHSFITTYLCLGLSSGAAYISSTCTCPNSLQISFLIIILIVFQRNGNITIVLCIFNYTDFFMVYFNTSPICIFNNHFKISIPFVYYL